MIAQAGAQQISGGARGGMDRRACSGCHLLCGQAAHIEPDAEQCQQREPTEPMTSSAWDVDAELPSHMEESIRRMRECEPMREVLGQAFVDAFLAVKAVEYATYNRVISSWEREHLLLLV